MTTLDFARKHIRFGKSSPITGPFRDEYYPFLRKPFAAADDITCKRLVIFKASSCLGTVAGQIINAKRIVCDVGDQKMVCQTDDDAQLWTKTRGKEWLKSIPDAMRLLSHDKYAITNDLWLFRHKFLEISGPGINSAQSVQVRYLQTDESHLDAYEPGRLIEFEKRLGARWDRAATHVTTAPDCGKEIDGFFLEGQQDEWCFRCPKCAELFWPLVGKEASEKYDQPIFWPSPKMDDGTACRCPHCGEWFYDTARARYDLVRDGDYVAQNPTPIPTTQSFRWSVFAAHWISWRETFLEHKAAMDAAKLGDLKPLEDFTKKRLCKQWKPYLPDFGEGKGKNDYKLGDVWVVDDSTRILTGDLQAGKASEGAHIHALVTQWDRAGNSRRIAYRRVETFAQMEAMQLEFGVESKNVYCDSGHENRLVFRECGKRKWYATRGSDATEILHTITQGKGRITFPMPYSQNEPQSGIVGEKQPDRLKRVQHGRLPEGWAYCVVMCNPTIYGMLSALIGGSSGRYFGIASNMDSCYVENMPAFIAIVEKNKKTNTDKTIWKQIREAHWWDLEVQALVGAMRAQCFPLAKSQLQEIAT